MGVATEHDTQFAIEVDLEAIEQNGTHCIVDRAGVEHLHDIDRIHGSDGQALFSGADEEGAVFVADECAGDLLAAAVTPYLQLGLIALAGLEPAGGRGDEGDHVHRPALAPPRCLKRDLQFKPAIAAPGAGDAQALLNDRLTDPVSLADLPGHCGLALLDRGVEGTDYRLIADVLL